MYPGTFLKMFLVVLFVFIGLRSSRAQNEGPPEDSTVVEGMINVTQKPGTKAALYCAKYMENCGGIRTGLLNELFYDPYPKSGVTHGMLSLADTHPYMVSVGYGPKKNWFCGGTLISEKFVLSAAHCVNEQSETPAEWIRPGQVDIGNIRYIGPEPTDYKIVRFIIHPDYRPPAMYNDIALFELDREVKFENSILPICLHTKPNIPYRQGMVTGWGRTGPAEGTSTHLREANVTFMSGSFCKQLRGNGSRIPQGVDTNSMICAGELQGITVPDTCQGDSGGPLLVMQSNRCINVQVGITSFGGLCGLPNSPSVYMKVYHYLEWIESHVWP